jgi:NAD-binding of NADP-dependent 3-hydroxyisobutyrate dehydrogenase
VIEVLGEALALVGKAGIDKRRYLECLASTLFDAPIFKTYGALIADGRFSPAGFAAPLGQKDIRLVLAAAEDLRVPMPVASLLRDRFLNLLAHGGEGLDWSAIGGLPATDAGTAPFRKCKGDISPPYSITYSLNRMRREAGSRALERCTGDSVKNTSQVGRICASSR